jgi:hypothetical protein
VTAHEPWAAFGEPGEMPALTPGLLASVRRAEALERHREEQERQERLERAENRREAWMWHRAQELAARGVPFDLSRPETLAETVEQMAEKIFSAQDRDARRLEIQAAKEAGLLHMLSISAADMAAGEVVLEPAEEVEERAIRTELLQARRRTIREGVRAKARRALKHVGRPS